MQSVSQELHLKDLFDFGIEKRSASVLNHEGTILEG